MGERIIKFIFFGNYFVGFLAIALSVETCVQLRVPFNSLLYYLLLFSGTVMYYTYAYTGVLQSTSTDNLRSEWYRQHRTLVRATQWFFLVICIVLSVTMLIKDFRYLLHLPILNWFIVGVIFLSSVFYYGLLPRSVFKLTLRNTGWLKAFVIGFVWAGCVSLIPIVVLQAEGTVYTADPVLMIWLFIKNWMFCTINAIMFDIKDYEDDSNKHLKTFVVQFGLRRTVTFILIPLSIVGAVSILVFTQYRHLSMLPVSIMLFPFLLLLVVSYSMYRQHSIFYYLIVIDGLVLIKAICGILAMQFITSS
jgi:4-hydroxybenzoate polyprenyltransferase